MIIFNTTYHVDDSCVKEWMDWSKNTYVPLLMETGMFTQHVYCRVMVEEQMGGQTFSLQLFLKDMQHYQKYKQEFATKVQAVLQAKFANRVLPFSTLLEEV